MIYTALKTYKQYRNLKIQNNTVPTKTKLYQYSLSARLKVNKKKENE